jgi:hypothetical protein
VERRIGAAVAPLTPSQERTRERVETLIGVMAPALTAVLAVGDRVSRIVQPEDHEYYPARPMSDRETAPGDIATEREPEN